MLQHPAINIESFTQAHIQTEFSHQPKLKFEFTLQAIDGREGAHFNDKRIVFYVHDGKIMSCSIMGLRAHEAGYTLKLTENLLDSKMITLEDAHGMIRMNLKAGHHGLLETAINHPANRYYLVPQV